MSALIVLDATAPAGVTRMEGCLSGRRTSGIIIPIASHDDHQHSFNQNLRIQNLWDGMELMAALLAS